MLEASIQHENLVTAVCGFNVLILDNVYIKLKIVQQITWRTNIPAMNNIKTNTAAGRNYSKNIECLQCNQRFSSKDVMEFHVKHLHHQSPVQITKQKSTKNPNHAEHDVNPQKKKHLNTLILDTGSSSSEFSFGRCESSFRVPGLKCQFCRHWKI
jgi:hypothetical protein